jgi:hypothetical protein
MPRVLRIRLGLLLLSLATACRSAAPGERMPAAAPEAPSAVVDLGEHPAIRIDTLPTRSALGVPPGGPVRLGYTPLPAGTRLLLVLDGEVVGLLPPMPQANELRADSSVAGRALAGLEPAQIASLSILRRYQAVERYGERASGGALIIETKRTVESEAP